MNQPIRAPWWGRIARDLVLFSTGLVLIVYEALFRGGTERPSLLVLYAGMIGLPAVLRYDEKRKESK